ncbi:MAG: beta-ketoacyl synthase N-terminal-like domain-containing protein [Porticoccaceae bacterium]|nr:hypothetical protein [Pseudomonadales bacterium]MCP5170687.1 hypothetical protein [Pseudomonadales bacterium]MCP5302072.1 hypothetical protein [Pseudomonadales bacterium]
MLDVVATSAFHIPLKDDEDLYDLSGDLQKYCRDRPRRIDRFTQLCLTGSGRCIQQLQNTNYNIDTDTGLYIGSRFAALSNTINVHKQMMQGGQIPKPAHFINTLSNSAGYYVARNLGLTGKNLFVSRAGFSTEAVLQTAILDIQSQQTAQALIGIVDEGVVPLSHHRQRLGLAPDTPISEGSYWLLAKKSSSGNQRAEGVLATITDTLTFCDSNNLQNWLKEPTDNNSQAQYYSKTLTQSELNQRFSIMSDSMQFWENLAADGTSSTASVLLNFITSKTWPTLITINGDEDGRYHVSRTVVYT